MTDEELKELVKRISMKYFNRSFKHEVSFNHRLRTTGGRYHLNTHNLDFNLKIFHTFGMKIFIGIIKHELCHYHLHLTNRGYQHGDKDFKELLNEVGGLRYTPSVEVKKGLLLRWNYRCERCQQNYYRKRRINVSKFVCSQCKGHLKLEGQKKIKLS